MFVEYAHRLTALLDAGETYVEEPCCMEGELSAVLVDVEHAALGADLTTGFQFVDHRRDAACVQGCGGGQAAETAADDGDPMVRCGRRHACSLSRPTSVVVGATGMAAGSRNARATPNAVKPLIHQKPC